ncbi:MAG: ABC transporter substrate-binding protein [Arachnia sp.]
MSLPTPRLLAAGLALLTVTACSAPATAPPRTSPTITPASSPASTGTAYPVTVSDCGTDVTVREAPRKVLTIGVAAVLQLDAAGAGDRIIGRAGEFDAGLGGADMDAKYAAVPIVDPSDPSAEAIVGTGADLVAGYGFYNVDPTTLADAGITSLTNLPDCGHDAGEAAPTPVTLDLVAEDIERWGRVFDTEETANAAAAELRAQVEELSTRRPAKTETAALLYYFGGALGSHGATNLTNDLMRRAGFENIYGDQNLLYLDPSRESVIDADPDWIILNYGVEGDTFDEALARLTAEPGFAELRALKEGRVIGLPNGQAIATTGAVDGLRTLLEGHEKGGSR